tara:strand:- start:422 stop:844 length:423 start_codon:yes stop_codon:yes gene_type:complete
MKTKTKKNKKAGMIRHLLSRELTGKTTPYMIEYVEKQKRNNIALKQIDHFKKITDDANTNNLNDINRALIYLSNSVYEDLLLNEDKEDMADFIKKLKIKEIELENRSTSRNRSRGKTVKRPKKPKRPKTPKSKRRGRPRK